jgi:bifunctional DNA-binding transcriptional regulator/antitoxin component of YhaV-PrlF toxin-antitoxin module
MQPNVSGNDKEQLTADLPTKSAKIRALHNAGYSRTEIADFLGIRYQHVRNVLVNDARVAEARPVAAASVAAEGHTALEPTRLRIGPEGRLAIPRNFREALNLRDGDVLIASVEEGQIRLRTLPGAIRKAQAIIRQFVPAHVSLVDELIADRRREAEREQHNG